MAVALLSTRACSEVSFWLSRRRMNARVQPSNLQTFSIALRQASRLGSRSQRDRAQKDSSSAMSASFPCPCDASRAAAQRSSGARHPQWTLP